MVQDQKPDDSLTSYAGLSHDTDLDTPIPKKPKKKGATSQDSGEIYVTRGGTTTQNAEEAKSS